MHQVHIATGDSLTARMFFPEDIVKLREQTPLLSNIHSLYSLYLHHPRPHTNSYFYPFVPHTCSFWNSLPFDISNAF